MNKLVFVIYENIRCSHFSSTIVGICSTKEKADKAVDMLTDQNVIDNIYYSYEEYVLDQLIIFL